MGTIERQASGVAGAPSVVNLKDAVTDFERSCIDRAIAEHDGDKRAAARALGIGLSTLYRKLGRTPPQ